MDYCVLRYFVFDKPFEESMALRCVAPASLHLHAEFDYGMHVAGAIDRGPFIPSGQSLSTFINAAASTHFIARRSESKARSPIIKPSANAHGVINARRFLVCFESTLFGCMLFLTVSSCNAHSDPPPRSPGRTREDELPLNCRVWRNGKNSKISSHINESEICCSPKWMIPTIAGKERLMPIRGLNQRLDEVPSKGS